MRGTQDEGIMGIMEGRGQRRTGGLFWSSSMLGQAGGGQTPWGSGWPSSPGWPGERRISRQTEARERRWGRAPGGGSTHYLYRAERLWAERSAQRVSQALARNIQQTITSCGWRRY